MSESPRPIESADVPSHVFKTFIDSLTLTDVPADVVERLNKTLLETPDLSERALTVAVLGDDAL